MTLKEVFKKRANDLKISQLAPSMKQLVNYKNKTVLQGLKNV